MTQTNLTRPQGLNRIDPVLREAAVELGVVEFRAETLPVEREQANLRAAQRAAAVDTDSITVESRSIPGPDDQQLGLRLYRGLTESPAPLVVYAHDGGFVTGNLDTDHAHCVELARDASCLVVSVDYRLAPENPCPAALDDVEAAFRYAVDNCAELDTDASRIAVMGRDAGAALVAGLTQRMFDQDRSPAMPTIHDRIARDCSDVQRASTRLFRMWVVSQENRVLHAQTLRRVFAM